MNTFLSSSKKRYKLARTILQALIGFISANIVEIVAMTQLSPEVQSLIVAGTMAVLTPIMAKLGEICGGENNAEL